MAPVAYGSWGALGLGLGSLQIPSPDQVLWLKASREANESGGLQVIGLSEALLHHCKTVPNTLYVQGFHRTCI